MKIKVTITYGESHSGVTEIGDIKNNKLNAKQSKLVDNYIEKELKPALLAKFEKTKLKTILKYVNS